MECNEAGTTRVTTNGGIMPALMAAGMIVLTSALANGTDAPGNVRGTIAGAYAWRLSRECPAEYAPKSDAEFQSLAREADFAFRQAWIFGPASAQTVVRYASLLMQTGRAPDARIVVATYLKLDPGNTEVMDFVEQQGQGARGEGREKMSLRLPLAPRPSPLQSASASVKSFWRKERSPRSSSKKRWRFNVSPAACSAKCSSSRA